jgi:hypothetical protein
MSPYSRNIIRSIVENHGDCSFAPVHGGCKGCIFGKICVPLGFGRYSNRDQNRARLDLCEATIKKDSKTKRLSANDEARKNLEKEMRDVRAFDLQREITILERLIEKSPKNNLGDTYTRIMKERLVTYKKSLNQIKIQEILDV